MKKFLIGILSALMLVSVVVVPAKAIVGGELVGTYTYDFVTYDNGMNGLWAKDTFHSTVKIYQLPEDFDYDYRVVREDTGTFEVISGAETPGGDGETIVGDGTKGTISGGETVYIDGFLKEVSSPVGPVDWTSDERSDGWFDLENLSRLQSPPYYEPFFNSENARGTFIGNDWGWTYTTCNNGTWVDNAETESAWNASKVKPVDLMGDITGDYVPCATPTTDVCANIDGDQASVPGGLHLDASGRNCVDYQFGGPPPPPPAVLGGQVLGASTLGATGGAEENIFLALFALGSILVGTGVRKLGVPRE